MASRERPILFSAPMVRAILSRAKTQTRRVVRDSKAFADWNAKPSDAYDVLLADDRSAAAFLVAGDQGFTDWIPCPFGAPGDRLWVRETWAAADRMYQGHELDEPRVVAYLADRSARRGFANGKPTPVPAYDLASWNWNALKGRPSIHMPRWASRLLLEVTAVRVERLQAISEDDARAEGALCDCGMCRRDLEPCMGEHRDAFAALWDSINGEHASWKSNPWVWVVEFKRTERGGGEG